MTSGQGRWLVPPMESARIKPAPGKFDHDKLANYRSMIDTATGSPRGDALRDAIKHLVREELGAYAYPRQVHSSTSCRRHRAARRSDSPCAPDFEVG